MINITKKAAEKLNEIKQKNSDKSNAMLRIEFGGHGWGGPIFNLSLDEKKSDNDIVVESEGVKIVFESDFEEYLSESTIDYSDSWYKRGFTIKGSGMSAC